MSTNHTKHVQSNLASWIISFVCISCVWAAAITCNCYIHLWPRKLARVSRHSFLSLSLFPLEIKKYGWLPRLVQWYVYIRERQFWLARRLHFQCWKSNLPHGLVNATQLPWVSMADSVSYVIAKMLGISTIHVMFAWSFKLPPHLLFWIENLCNNIYAIFSSHHHAKRFSCPIMRQAYFSYHYDIPLRL